MPLPKTRMRTLPRLALSLAVLTGVCAVPLIAAPSPSAAAGSEPTIGRIAYTEGDQLYVKEGDLDAEPIQQDADVKEFQMAGDRIAVLTTDGALLVKEGDLGPGWQTVDTDSVTDFQLEGDRIAYTEGDQLYVREGDLDAESMLQDADVKKFQLVGDRIGVQTPDGELLVKEGDLGPGWETVDADSVTDFQMEGDRIAYAEGDQLYVREGDLDAESVQQDADVKKFQLAGDRIGVLTPDGELLVKGGDLEPGWEVIDPDSVTDFALAGDRIAFTEGTDLYVREGALDSESVFQDSDVKKFQLAGDRIAALKGDELLVKEGDLDPGWFTVDADSVTDFQLLAPTQFSDNLTVSMTDLKSIFGYLGAPSDEAIINEGLERLNEEMDNGQISATIPRIAAWLSTLHRESGFRYNAGEAGNTSNYRGRGYIQLTGVANYTSAGNFFGHDFVAAPNDAASLDWSAAIARWYWTVARSTTNQHADNLDMGAVDRNIGYAPNPAEDSRRCTDFQAALRYYNDGQLPPGPINCVR